MFIDVHCHLNEFNNPEKEIEKAKQENVCIIVSNSVDLESMEKNLVLCKQFNGVECALGIHPSNLLLLNENQLAKALHFMEKNCENAIAVGEIGLDFKHANTPKKREKQLHYFRLQLEIAERFQKPVIVHSRLAAGECINEVIETDCKKALFHWFSGSSEALGKALDLNCYFSIGPAVEFSHSIQQIVERIPLNRVLSETDAPVPSRGVISSPSWIPRVVRKISKIKKTNASVIEAGIQENFKEFFGKVLNEMP